MFKSLFSFIKAFFVLAEDATGVADNAVQFALLQSETWIKEAYAENQSKSAELDIDDAAMQQKIKALRKSQNH